MTLAAATTTGATPLGRPSMPGEPAWEIALLFPEQGRWTESAYLALKTNRLVELSDGCLEVLPMADAVHQRILKYLAWLMDAFVRQHALGEVLFAPFPIRLWPEKMREPDIVFMRPGRMPDPTEPPNGVDLALEIVSPGEESRRRDLVKKPQEYAKAGIHEYWIVDPQEHRITVLVLDGQSYREHGVFGPGSQATSQLLAGFSVSVDAVFAAGQAVRQVECQE